MTVRFKEKAGINSTIFSAFTSFAGGATKPRLFSQSVSVPRGRARAEAPLTALVPTGGRGRSARAGFEGSGLCSLCNRCVHTHTHTHYLCMCACASVCVSVHATLNVWTYTPCPLTFADWFLPPRSEHEARRSRASAASPEHEERPRAKPT